MKRIIIIAVLACLSLFHAAAQVDSVFVKEAELDSTLYGKNIFSLISQREAGQGTVTIDQPGTLVSAMATHKTRNASKQINGYRVRIFFDNSRNARGVSEQVAGQFSALYPSVAVYREYENPYFKVTVGNFRTKADATRFLNAIKGQFPSGFIVRERITYPSF
jgi:hypothetical protein